MRKRAMMAAASIVILVGIAAAALYFHANRIQQYCLHVPCGHLLARLAVIEADIRATDGEPSYLAIGDSITEQATLPAICGRKPINAGIGWARVHTFAAHGPRLAEMARPDFIVIALGTNDALYDPDGDFREKLSTLLGALAAWRVVLVPVPPGTKVVHVRRFNRDIAALSVPQAAALDHVETHDGIHPTAASYAAWSKSIVDAVELAVCRKA